MTFRGPSDASSKGGLTRAANLSPERRREIASLGGRAKNGKFGPYKPKIRKPMPSLRARAIKNISSALKGYDGITDSVHLATWLVDRYPSVIADASKPALTMQSLDVILSE